MGTVQTASTPEVLEDLLTGAEVAGLLKTKDRHLARLRREHGLPYFKIGGACRYSRRDVAAWLESRREVVTTDRSALVSELVGVGAR